jgi:hypothetical protein
MSFLGEPTIFKSSPYTAIIANPDMVFLIKIHGKILLFLNLFSRRY